MLNQTKMKLTQQTASLLRHLFEGGNYAGSNMNEHLSDVTKDEAVMKIHSFNPIATLVFHMNYYIEIVIRVAQGGKLTGSDKLSFDHPQVTTEADWDNMRNRIFANAEQLAVLIEKMPDEMLLTGFEDGKFGTWYRNLHGIIEHTHYHLGQIALLKKMIRTGLVAEQR